MGGSVKRLYTMVFRTTPVESDPAKTFENVHTVGALARLMHCQRGGIDQKPSCLPGRHRFVGLCQLKKAGQHVLFPAFVDLDLLLPLGNEVTDDFEDGEAG